MRKLSLVLALVAVSMAAASLPAWGAPSNTGTEVNLDCEETGQVAVLVQFESSGAAVFDAALEGNGRRYVLSFLDFRGYLGDFGDDEPAVDPDFAETKTWGERKGYNATLTCSGSIVLIDPAVGPFTSFFDLVLSGK